jgi:hypothetical protein
MVHPPVVTTLVLMVGPVIKIMRVTKGIKVTTVIEETATKVTITGIRATIAEIKVTIIGIKDTILLQVHPSSKDTTAIAREAAKMGIVEVATPMATVAAEEEGEEVVLGIKSCMRNYISALYDTKCIPRHVHDSALF